MKQLVTAVLTCVLSLLLGCATLFADKVNPIPLQSTPSGVEVFIDGIKRGRTPLTLELDPRRSYTVVFKGEGLEDRVFDVRNEVGVGWVVLDVLFGGLPALIDAQTGAWYSLVPNAVQVSMLPGQAPRHGEQPAQRGPTEPGPRAEQGPPPQPAPPPAPLPAVKCDLSGTPEWQNASAVQKKKLLDECRRKQQGP